MYSVILAYNNTREIPTAVEKRVNIDLIFAYDAEVLRSYDEDKLFDNSVIHSINGFHKILTLYFDPDSFAENQIFLRNFLTAPHTWAAYGNFTDIDNIEDNSLCKAFLDKKEIAISIEAALKGYKLISERVF